MKIIIVIACIVIGGILCNPGNICTAQTTPASIGQASLTNLPTEVEEIVILTQAKMSETVILTKIKNGGVSYNLTTDQIIYLSNQGVSQNVISALLQNKPASVAPVPAINVADTNLNSQPSTAVVEPPALDTGDQTSISDDPVIVKGKGFEIKQSELDAVMTGLKSAAAAHNQTVPPGQMTQIKSQLLDRLIQVQLLLQLVTETDESNGVAKANLQLSALLERAGSREVLEQQMKAVGMTTTELRTKVTQENTAQAVLTRELNVSVTDAEAKKFYDEHPADFKQPGVVKKMDYTTAAPKIKDYLAQQQTEKLAPPYIEKLKKAADVQILDADLK